KCRVTARAVGYPVPCPTYVPAGLAVGSSTTPTGCLDVIGPGGRPACGPAGKSWRGWVVGTSDVGRDHLVITASPKPLTNDAKLVNGPAWYPRARVRTVGWVNIKGWRMRAVYVPPATNDGSAFMHHVVLVWSDAGHTYGVGFHNTRGIRQTLLLDEELAKHITLIEPRGGGFTLAWASIVSPGGGGLRPPEPHLRGTRVNPARGLTGETGFPP